MGNVLKNREESHLYMKRWMFFIVGFLLLAACSNQEAEQNDIKQNDTSGTTQVSAKEENLEGKKVNEITLQAEESQWELNPQKMVDAWTFNGSVPGQPIRVKQGEAVRITLKNNINEPVSSTGMGSLCLIQRTESLVSHKMPFYLEKSIRPSLS